MKGLLDLVKESEEDGKLSDKSIEIEEIKIENVNIQPIITN